MAGRNRPLDKSHHPFKRSRKIGPGAGGPGPKGEKRTVEQKGDWECSKITPKPADRKKYYVQLCVFVGDDPKKRGKKKPVKIKKAYKKAYNKKNDKRLKQMAKPKFANAYSPRYNARTGRAKRK